MRYQLAATRADSLVRKLRIESAQQHPHTLRKTESRNPPFALKYSAFCISSMPAIASSSSLKKACSSSYSPGRLILSKKIFPRLVYRKKYTIAMMMPTIAAEPNADIMPMRMPLPVEFSPCARNAARCSCHVVHRAPVLESCHEGRGCGAGVVSAAAAAAAAAVTADVLVGR